MRTRLLTLYTSIFLISIFSCGRISCDDRNIMLLTNSLGSSETAIQLTRKYERESNYSKLVSADSLYPVTNISKDFDWEIEFPNTKLVFRIYDIHFNNDHSNNVHNHCGNSGYYFLNGEKYTFGKADGDDYGPEPLYVNLKR